MYFREETITAGDIGKFLNGFQVLNPELVIAHCEPSVKIKLEITIEKGRGYVPADENKPANAAHGVIPIDAIYTPIRNVKFSVEELPC